jgi:phosphate:Na+ symporter
MDIEVVSYPLFVLEVFFLSSLEAKTYRYISYFLFGFGLLFIGLSFMKTSMEAQVKVLIFHNMLRCHWPFLLIGFIITVLVQSSSVTMALH